MLMTHSAEVVIDDCDQEDDDQKGGGVQKEFNVIQFCFVVLIAICLQYQNVQIMNETYFANIPFIGHITFNEAF